MKQLSFRFLLLLTIFPACTGKNLLNNPSIQKGGFVIQPGEKLTVDLQDVVALNTQNYVVSLKSISPDFSSASVLFDLTQFAQNQVASGSSSFQFVMPKSVAASKPFLIVVDLIDQDAQFIDVVFDQQPYLKPGLASTLAYNLAKFYTTTDVSGAITSVKKLNEYSSADFNGIKSLIQTRIDQLLSTSEHLSLATTEWRKLNRYFMNGLAFNIDFLTAIKSFGIDYQWTDTTPSGLLASDTPEGSLNHYKYATAFKVNGQSAGMNPLNHLNSPPQMMSGVVQPNPGQGLFVSEGNAVSVTAQGFDIDDDFIDKDMIIQYIPRVLPAALTARVIPEPTPSYQTITTLSAPGNQDHYSSDVIGFNEALDLSYYTTDGDTAYRNVYYLISDGMVVVPYRWNFKYADVNRSPVIVSDQNKINDTSFDSLLVEAGDTYPPTWKQHASHCETDPSALYGADPVPYQSIHKRADGPWSCAFKVVDSDLDEDPNAAPDVFNYTVDNISEYAQALAGDPSVGATNPRQYIWPPLSPYTTSAPKRVGGKILPTCTTPDGANHFKCGIGLVQITIDNGVKVAAETQSDLQFPYNIVVYDRDQVGGKRVSHSVNRKIEFTAVPPRIVNYESAAPDATIAHASTIDSGVVAPVSSIVWHDLNEQENVLCAQATPPANLNCHKVYKRWDAYLSDIVTQAGTALGGDLTKIGLDASMAGTAARARAFLQGTATPLSGYITQPHKTTTTFNGASLFTTGVTTGATTGALTWLGHSLTTADATLYSHPREFDSSCKLSQNNSDPSHPTDAWTQDAAGNQGWVFEMDAVDLDNVGLRIGEPTDPVYIQPLSHDIQTSLNANGILFCQYNAPNLNALTYQTYQQIDPPAVTTAKPAVNAEACVWTTAPPNQMQPVPIYYETTNSLGQPIVQKLVYHRLRIKWQPKDQGVLPLGKTYVPPVGYLQNVLSSLNIYGNRLLVVTDTLDQTKPPVQFNLFAEHKDMLPCVTGVSPSAVVTNYIHQLNKTEGPFQFSVSDENRTLGSSNSLYLTQALRGRYEAELSVRGTRDIFNADFQRLIPYVEDCTRIDTVVPAGTPAPQNALSAPEVFYTRADDAANIPRVRLQSTSVDNSTIASSGFTNKGSFCIAHQYAALKKDSLPYNEIIVIQNKAILAGSSSYTLNLNALLPGCTAFSASASFPVNRLLSVNPDQKYIAVASTCGSSHNVNDLLWDDAFSSATVTSIFNVTDYGLPATAPFNLDIFPQFYGTDKISIVNPASNFTAANEIYYDVLPIDNFKIDSTTHLPSYTGYTNWLSTSDASVVGPNPKTDGMPFYGMQAIDWDNQASYMALAAPTPDASLAGTNVFFRATPGDTNRIQVFVKNRAAAMFPIQASDVAFGASFLELDPYDIKQFTLLPPATPAVGTPSFVGIGRALCTDAPVGYPALATLNFTSLANYNKCNFSWTPAAADDGVKYAYSFTVQDNYNATSTVMGEGGRHPAASTLTNIFGDSAAKTNGPTSTYGLDIESLESNTAPFFTATLNGATINLPYNSAGGASGWTSVYANEAIPGKAPPASCGGAPSGFSCSLSVADNHILQSATPVSLSEGTSYSFDVYAKDTNVTAQLKTLSATKPLSVLIVDGPYKGKTYSPPSFTSMTISGGGVGTTKFSFTWKPTDAEANYLSNSGGFLIPVKITDQQYAPASDPSFPSQFVTPALNNTVWIWAKLSVKNLSPVVYKVDTTTGVETPLNGLTLTAQTGASTVFKIRVKDADIARWTQSSDYSGFAATGSTAFYTSFLGNSGSNFITVTPAATPYASPAANPQYIYQDLFITAAPSNNDIGTYAAPSVSFTDPGDKSLGLAINPDAGTPPSAMVAATGNGITAPFSIQVIGKPLFLVPNPVPNPAGSQVYAYHGNPFYYPLSLSISRPTELKKNFFVGIDASTTVTPLKTTASGNGIFINEKYILRWPAPTFSEVGNPVNRAIPVYAVVQSDCLAPTGTTGGTAFAKTLIRYNESTGAMETCKLPTTQLTNNASSQVTNLLLVDASLKPVVPTITQTQIDRVYAPTVAPASVSVAMDQQYAEFKKRCTNCSTSPNSTTGASPSGMSLGAYNPSGNVQYLFNSYQSTYTFQTAPSLSVQKSYADLTPTSVRALNVMASKGETLTFSANLSSADSRSHYRWYVNGCLKAAGLVTSTTVMFNYLLHSLSSGANNDCTGEYGFSEANATALGKVIVRLSVVNSTQDAGTASDNSPSTYVYNVNVLNTDPNLQTLTTYAPAAPVNLNTYLTGNLDVQFSIPVTYPTANGKNYLAFTDGKSNGTAANDGLKVRLREFNANGDLPATGASVLSLSCDSQFTSQPNWIGIHPHPTDSNKLYIAASISPPASFSPSYPYTSTAAPLAYGMKNQTCFTNAINVTNNTTAVNYINYSSGSTTPAAYLGFSKYTMSVNSTAAYSTSTSLYAGSTSDTSFYFMDGMRSVFQFWSYAMSSIYGSAQTEFTSFPSNVVRKNIVAGDKHFQLIGAPSSGSSGWRGFILGNTLAPASPSSSGFVAATRVNRIMFADGDAALLPAAVAQDCQFKGTPIDGVYSADDDSLYVVTFGNDVSGKGHLVQIENASTANPTCTVVGDTLNPSLNIGTHNPNITKMVLDAAKGMIYGVINQGAGLSPQVFTFDIYTKKLTTRDLSSSIVAYELIYSPGINGIFVLDNRKSTVPTLYKVW